jgi:hypothetical protein
LHKADEEKSKVENEQRARLRAKKEEHGHHDENGGFVPVHFDKDEHGVWHIKETSRAVKHPPTYVAVAHPETAQIAETVAPTTTTTTTTTTAE